MKKSGVFSVLVRIDGSRSSFLQAGIPPVIVAHHKTIEQRVV
jgi:hypothetical protein